VADKIQPLVGQDNVGAGRASLLTALLLGFFFFFFFFGRAACFALLLDPALARSELNGWLVEKHNTVLARPRIAAARYDSHTPDLDRKAIRALIVAPLRCWAAHGRWRFGPLSNRLPAVGMQMRG